MLIVIGIDGVASVREEIKLHQIFERNKNAKCMYI